jgi:hypothetical protein
MRKLFLLTVTMLLISCTHKIDETTICGKEIENISYKSDVKPIIREKCMGCHQDYFLYDSLNAHVSNGDFYKRVLHNRDMPPSGGLDTCDYIVLKRWYYNGHTSN